MPTSIYTHIRMSKHRRNKYTALTNLIRNRHFDREPKKPGVLKNRRAWGTARLQLNGERHGGQGIRNWRRVQYSRIVGCGAGILGSIRHLSCFESLLVWDIIYSDCRVRDAGEKSDNREKRVHWLHGTHRFDQLQNGTQEEKSFSGRKRAAELQRRVHGGWNLSARVFTSRECTSFARIGYVIGMSKTGASRSFRYRDEHLLNTNALYIWYIHVSCKTIRCRDARNGGTRCRT